MRGLSKVEEVPEELCAFCHQSRRSTLEGVDSDGVWSWLDGKAYPEGLWLSAGGACWVVETAEIPDCRGTDGAGVRMLHSTNTHESSCLG